MAFRRHFGREMFLNVLQVFAGKALPEHLNLESKNDFRRSFCGLGSQNTYSQKIVKMRNCGICEIEDADLNLCCLCR